MLNKLRSLPSDARNEFSEYEDFGNIYDAFKMGKEYHDDGYNGKLNKVYEVKEKLEEWLAKIINVYDNNGSFVGDPDNWKRGRIFGTLTVYESPGFLGTGMGSDVGGYYRQDKSN